MEEVAISLKLFSPKGKALCESKENEGKLISTPEHLEDVKTFLNTFVSSLPLLPCYSKGDDPFQTKETETQHYTVIN